MGSPGVSCVSEAVSPEQLGSLAWAWSSGCSPIIRTCRVSACAWPPLAVLPELSERSSATKTGLNGTSAYVLLAKVIGGLVLVLGAFLLGKHLQAKLDEGAMQKMRADQAVAIANEQARSHGIEIAAPTETAKVTHDYQNQLQASQAAVVSSAATVRSLRDQLAAYAGGANVPQAAGVPVSAAD